MCKNVDMRAGQQWTYVQDYLEWAFHLFCSPKKWTLKQIKPNVQHSIYKLDFLIWNSMEYYVAPKLNVLIEWGKVMSAVRVPLNTQTGAKNLKNDFDTSTEVGKFDGYLFKISCSW